jgi:hypothetical protein
MHRLFGKPKAAAPTPTLSDASTSINNRVGALDEKIKGAKVAYCLFPFFLDVFVILYQRSRRGVD